MRRFFVVLLLAVLMVLAVSCNGEVISNGSENGSGQNSGNGSGSGSGNSSGEVAVSIDPTYVGLWTYTTESERNTLIITEDGRYIFTSREIYSSYYCTYAGTISFEGGYITLSIDEHFETGEEAPETQYVFFQDGTTPGTKKIALAYSPTPEYINIVRKSILLSEIHIHIQIRKKARLRTEKKEQRLPKK